MRRTLITTFAAAVVAVGTGVGTVAATSPAIASPLSANSSSPPAAGAGHGGPRHSSLPSVYPVPHSMTAHGRAVVLGDTVALVTGTGSDADSVAALKTMLSQDGVRHVDQVGSTHDLRAHETAIYVGGPEVVSASTTALRDLKAGDATNLPAEGYVLATGAVADHPSIVLDGHDGTGTFYAVQTLRQLIERHGRSSEVPGVLVRDWPTMPVRGTIEGFYGAPWSDAQRAAQLQFYGQNKMNTYIYSPKDDPYLRAQWRDPYPAAQLAAIKALVDTAGANHVQFTYALSPGLSICYSSASDEQALVAKLQSLWNIGVRSFSIPFDDISYTDWNCAADQTKFGAGGGAAGAAQSYVLNEVQKDFIDTHPGAQPLQMVPTEYSDVSATPYKAAIKADLSAKVIVGWTGVGVIAPTISTAQAAAAKSVYGHDILLWDNYPVNDYVTNRLLLGPYVGRSSDLGTQLYGITANPMIEPEASKIALFTVADYAWNGADYNPQKSFQASLTQLAGPSGSARTALAAFADLEHYSDIDPVQAPVLAGKLKQFWSEWESGTGSAARTLDSYLTVIQNIPTTLTADMNDPEFVSEAQPWLDAAGHWGSAARDALQMLVAERDGNGAAAIRARAQAQAQVTQAKSAKVEMGDGVIDTFVSSALAENSRWLGLTGNHVSATTSMPTYQSDVPANMVDGNASTFFWSSRTPAAGDYVGVDLGATQPISTVTISGGDAASPDDYIHNATLEYSSDGTTWTTVQSYTDTADITATLPAGTTARYVRLVATASDANWVKIHEFTVSAPAEQKLAVSGTPAAASGSSLAAAVDGDVDTSYTAASSPASGDALLVTLPKARPLSRVEVVGTGSAQVQVQSGGSWATIGSLSTSGYTELDASGVTASAIRLEWTAGSSVPKIAEVVPWYADVPTASVVATPPSVETSVGQQVDLSVQLLATQPRNVPGTLSVTAPNGLSVHPSTERIEVDRGSQQSIALTGSASRAGTYPVTITFEPRHGAEVSTTVTVTVHPAVSSTNVALSANGAVASASSTEDGLAQFTADHANDGDLTTRWSSNHDDNEWLQVKFASPQDLGEVVIHWEAAYATGYRLQTSTDGKTWTTVDSVTNGTGGTETDWINASGVSYLRMQGLSRATAYGYSIYELQAYPLS
ncbi:beta-N-acetylglucosaminidase domain-containing protein [Leekyejoonella antrihumi]|uniref:Beta-N-acetylhexosaminidase n=1 Tax=Leekyejoonella antrihumi TaxID=1660198 RepID=A0A563DV22_9MICO|nr:beta-N-acetylglucosaminidase domain-containing protein [Leekyejoonella antrihumi]TWP34100.1 beta-N-acetylhexosaminidase [Leekyejoonella antrihumi]